MRKTHSPHGKRTALARSRAFTLVEVALAASIAVILLGLLGTVLIGSTRALDYTMKGGVSIHGVDRLASRLRRELVSSSQSRLVIDTSASDGDKLTFQQSRSTGNGQVEWGTYDSQRNWVPNGAIRYTVANQNLVRQILSGSGAITFEEIIVQGVSSGAERGFTASRVGSLVQLTVRSRQSTTDGSNITRDWEMAMRLGAS